MIPSMASALQKILTRSLPNTKFLTPSLQRLSQVPPFKPSEPQTPSIQRPFPPIHPLPETEISASSCSSVVFPSFPFGFFLDPTHPIIPPSPADSHGGGDDDSGKLWADSVKKKRKRKMNKHKYKKLRKRMRRQS